MAPFFPNMTSSFMPPELLRCSSFSHVALACTTSRIDVASRPLSQVPSSLSPVMARYLTSFALSV